MLASLLDDLVSNFKLITDAVNELFAGVLLPAIISQQTHVCDHPLQVLLSWLPISRTLRIPGEDGLDNFTLGLLSGVGVVPL